MDELSAREYDVQGKNVSGRKAVFEAMGSPAFSATLPPMVQTLWEDGSGA